MSKGENQKAVDIAVYVDQNYENGGEKLEQVGKGTMHNSKMTSEHDTYLNYFSIAVKRQCEQSNL